MGISKREVDCLNNEYTELTKTVNRNPSIPYEYKLDPSPNYDFTVQSRQFAIVAKSYVHLHWKRQNGKLPEDAKKYSRKFLICFPFLTNWRRPNRINHESGVSVIKPISDSVYELIGESLILTEDHIQSIGVELPARAVGFPWSLKFCSSRDGFSLATLYRKLSKSDSPILIVIEDLSGRVFGAMSSSKLELSDNYFGTSECFLFTATPEFKLYRWNGDNFHFVLATQDSLSFGSMESGKPGLCFDCDLNKGWTGSCLTYGNEPLIPDGSDFIIKNLECWTFD